MNEIRTNHNWELIRQEYVASPSHPSFDDIVKKYRVAKATVVKVANDPTHEMNGGLTWAEAKANIIAQKRETEMDLYKEESRAAVKKATKKMHGVVDKLYLIYDKYLTQVIKDIQEAEDNGERIDLPRNIKFSDLVKSIQVISELSVDGHNKSQVSINFNMNGENKKIPISVTDLSDEQLDEIDSKMHKDYIEYEEI